MKGDFSRQTFNPTKHYSGVLLQQGRVQLDADWNEQQAIHQHRIETETQDVIGPCGAPLHEAGFQVTVQTQGILNRLLVSKGRYYVDGMLCENEADTFVLNLPPLLPGGNPSIIYLDVWQGHVTALDDSHIREVALGGPDTTTRRQTVWKVKRLQLLSSNNVTCDGSFREWDELIAPSTGTLTARTQPAPAKESPCLLPPSAGYQRLENQLYRVEIHHGSDRPDGPTFKWSRDNGTVVTAIEKIDGQTITVHDVGKDDLLGFASGQWGELVDGEQELSAEPGPLRQIDQVNPAARTISVQTPLPPLQSEVHYKLRRWDQTGESVTADGVKIISHRVPLENGIEVEFSNGTYHAGDYWLIPARTATGEIEWPPYEVPNTNPLPQPPLGIQHHYCRLALVTPSSGTWQVQDCRKFFSPLARSIDETAGTLPTVIGIDWQNDRTINLDRFNQGFTVTFSHDMHPATASPNTFIVTLEVVAEPQERFHPGNRPVIVPGRVDVLTRPPRWRFVPQPAVTPAELIIQPIRCRIALKGNTILDTMGRPLDGEVFGRLSTLTNPITGQPFTDLILPSGDGNKGGDFESWFLLQPPQAP